MEYAVGIVLAVFVFTAALLLGGLLLQRRREEARNGETAAFRAAQSGSGVIFDSFFRRNRPTVTP